jgi:hypothetical protein
VRPFSLRREISIGLAVYGLYLLVRWLVLRGDGRERARRNGQRVVEMEEALGIHVEPQVQEALLRFPRLVHGLNVGYALFNVSLTVGWLAFLYRRRDPAYHRVRRSAALTYVAVQPVFLLFPTAPPRVLDGFVDTISEVSGFDIEHPFLLRFYNPIAAMPSLHVAFAVLTGAAIAERATSPLGKGAAYGYAPLVAVVVAGTGNHYVLDALAGAALGAAARSVT